MERNSLAKAREESVQAPKSESIEPHKVEMSS